MSQSNRMWYIAKQYPHIVWLKKKKKKFVSLFSERCFVSYYIHTQHFLFFKLKVFFPIVTFSSSSHFFFVKKWNPFNLNFIFWQSFMSLVLFFPSFFYKHDSEPVRILFQCAIPRPFIWIIFFLLSCLVVLRQPSDFRIWADFY